MFGISSFRNRMFGKRYRDLDSERFELKHFLIHHMKFFKETRESEIAWKSYLSVIIFVTK